MSQRQLTLWDMLKYEAKQFCLNTALHGYRFIVLPKRILLERVFWVVIVLISLGTALSLLLFAWFSFQENPTILVTDSTHYPIWNYPYPAVTVCSFNQIPRSRAYAFVRLLEKKPPDMSVDDLAKEMRILYQLIFNNNENIAMENYARLQDILDSNNFEIDTVMRMLAPRCSDLIQRCKWKGEEKRCESLFEPIRTSEGYCCSFNYHALKNHTFGGALANKIPPFPRRVSACGYLTALELLVNNQPDDYFASQIAAIGHRILIHNSYDYPDWSIQSILVEKQVNNLIGIIPSITYSTPSVISVDVEKRHCLFNNESQLHNFVYYSFHNCMTECRMNLTRKLCGCIPFYYLHQTGTYPQTKICNLRDIPCLTEHRSLIMSSVPGFDPTGAPKDHDWGTEKHLCSICIPDCDYVDYSAEASSGIFTRQFSSNQQNLFGGVTIRHQSVVRVYFNDLVATKNRRDVVFSWHTLLAFYGGLLGLFTGFSFVSAVEFIYFFTVRLMLDIKQKNEVADNTKKKKKQLVNVKPHHEEILNPKNLMVMQYHDRFLRRRSHSNS